MAKVGVVIPVLNRPARVKPLVETFRASCTRKQAELCFVAQRDDEAEIDALVSGWRESKELFEGINLIIVNPENRSWAKKVNEAFSHTDEPWLLLGGDDLNFRPGWFEALEPRLSQGYGVIGTADVISWDDIANPRKPNAIQSSAHPVVSREYIKEYGSGTLDNSGIVVHPGYDHNFPDTELVATAAKRGRYVYAPEVVIEHLHPAYGKSKFDDTYRLGQKNLVADRKLYEARSKRLGWLCG